MDLLPIICLIVLIDGKIKGINLNIKRIKFYSPINKNQKEKSRIKVEFQ